MFRYQPFPLPAKGSVGKKDSALPPPGFSVGGRAKGTEHGLISSHLKIVS